MKTLTRDIRFTLVIKFSLLFILWFVCFKGVKKPELSMQQWLLGSPKPVQYQTKDNV